MKKIIEKIAIALYFIGLFAFPVYKIIETQIQIDGFLSLCGLILSFLLYLFGWWFFYTPICGIIASFFFLKGDDAKDMRCGCGYPLLAVILFIVGSILFSKCHNDTNNTTKTDGVYTSVKGLRYNPTKNIKDDKRINNRVYICTGPQSRRYHRSPYCRGLNNCSYDIEAVDVETAEDKDRTPCGICY